MGIELRLPYSHSTLMTITLSISLELSKDLLVYSEVDTMQTWLWMLQMLKNCGKGKILCTHMFWYFLIFMSTYSHCPFDLYTLNSPEKKITNYKDLWMSAFIPNAIIILLINFQIDSYLGNSYYFFFLFM